MRFLLIPTWTTFLAVAPSVLAQGTSADYERARNLAAWTRNKLFRTSVQPRWNADATAFWYRVDVAPGEHEFVAVNVGRGTRTLAFDHPKLAAALAGATGRNLDARSLPLDDLVLDPAGKVVDCRAFGKWYRCSLDSYQVKETAPPATPRQASRDSLPASLKVRPSRRTGDNTTVLFVNEGKAKLDLFWVDPDGREKSYGSLAPGSEHLQNTYAGHVWVLRDAGKKAVAVFEAVAGGGRAVVGPKMRLQPKTAPKTPRGRPASESPDGTRQVLFRDHNVVLLDKKAGTEHVLTRQGTAEDGFGGAVHWSPDGSRFVVLRTRRGEDRRIPLIESTPRDQLFPKLHTLAYAKPGDRIDVARPYLFEAATRREIPVPHDLFANPWSLTRFHWDEAGKEFRFVYNQRGHQVLRLVGIDGRTGRSRAIIDETRDGFIDYNGKFFLQDTGAGEYLWMSERDGWNHLYLVDAATGKIKNRITNGDWLVRGVDRVDTRLRRIWFRAGGIHPGQDPYHVHHARIDFDGTGLVLLTHGDGTHTIKDSPDGRHYLDTYSRVDLPPVTELRRAADGSLVCVLEKGDMSALVRAGWQPPERFVAKGRDGVTDIHGIFYRPTNFDPAKKYPVIEAIYAGPQGSFVPKDFQAHRRHQELAELGFIVVQIDGMGTSNRSRAFHQVCWKNLGDSGFPDRILWIKAAAAKFPFMDIRKVGIFGGSAGGQSALRALLAHGDFYYVAVADCGCHDNRIDKIWWNELWMGYPIGPHYREQSNATNAHKLRGKLLLTVGEMDRNVDPASTMQVVDALVTARKDFDLLVVPGAGHGVGESPYAARRRMDFFVRHLLGVEPPDRNGKE